MSRSVWLIVRSFVRARGFAVASVSTVALGIGITTCLFSLFDGVLFRPLPFGQPDRLVQLESERRAPSSDAVPTLNLVVTQLLSRHHDLFSGIAWVPDGTPVPMTPVAGDNPLLWLTPVTYNALEVLGVRPATGSGFALDEPPLSDDIPVMLTYETWQRRYGGSDDVLSAHWEAPGPNQFHTSPVHWYVVGVLPKGFILPSPRLITRHYDGIYAVDSGLTRSLPTSQVETAPFARLATGVSISAAQQHATALIASGFPTSSPSYRKGVAVRPLHAGLSAAVSPYAWLAFIGAWVVLGVTCLTLAILLFTWGQSRRHDAGVRLALGAPHRRLVLTAVLESLLICSAGAFVGWLAQTWARPFFFRMLPISIRPLAETTDLRLTTATAALALASGLVAGLTPALRMRRIAPLDALRDNHDANPFDYFRDGAFPMAAQAILGAMLVVGAAATGPPAVRHLLTDPGFRVRDLFIVYVPTAAGVGAGDAPEQTRRGQAEVAVMRGMPGVVAVGLSRTDPFSPEGPGNSLFQKPAGFDGRVMAVDGHFFVALGTPMIAGRAFTDDEVGNAALVAIVNVRCARALWPGVAPTDVLGRTVVTRDGPRVVVGVAADLRRDTNVPATPDLFLPVSARETYRPDSTWNEFKVMVRMAAGRIPDQAFLSRALRDHLPDGYTAVFVESVAATLAPSRGGPRVIAVILGALACIALVLAVMSMYGLADFEIRRRRDEMAIRMALGATPGALRRRLVLIILKPVLGGLLIGLSLGWAGLALLRASVPLVETGGATAYIVAGVVVLMAAVIAAWIPGRRLARMRVADVLRS
jgi:putative ABC transport system permease protein